MSQSSAVKMKPGVDVHFVFSDMQGAASSIALLARLCAMRNGDLLRLRVAIGEAPSALSGSMAWLDHALGWEQDRRAGYHYPLRGPTEMMRDAELAERVAAVEMLTTRFRDDTQIAELIHLVGLIVDGGTLRLHQRLRHGYKSAA